MTIVGFEKTSNGIIKEYLPKNEQLASEYEQRQMFLHMFNTYVEKKMKLSKKEMLHGDDLYQVFKNKIESMLFMPCILQNQPPQMNGISWLPTHSIAVFVQGGYKNRLIKPQVSLSLISNMIDLIYNHSETKLFCDLDDMFLHLVYERTKQVNRHNEVLLFEKTIVINQKNKSNSSILIIPAYGKVDHENMEKDPIISKHMKTVLSTLKETQIRQIYLIYPKHTSFKRHLTVKLLDKIPLKEDEYRVKVIPYSFSFCIKNQKNTTHTRRQKCQ